MAITQHHTKPEDNNIIVNRPLEDWSVSQLATEIEADYNDGRQVRLDVLNELICRAEAAELTAQ